MGFLSKKSKAAPANETNEKVRVNNAPKKVKFNPKSMQDILDFQDITPEGIVIGRKGYTKLYKLTDSNFCSEPLDVQEEVLKRYANVISRFGDNVDFNIVVVNKKATESELKKDFFLKPKGLSTDKYATAYNEIVETKMKEGNNSIIKDKYILMTVHTDKGLTDAQSAFNTIDITLNEGVKEINKIGVKPATALERVDIIHRILNGDERPPYEREFSDCVNVESGTVDVKALKKKGMSLKDSVCPLMVVRENDYLQLAPHRFVRSFGFTNLPHELDTSFLTTATDLPYEMVTVIQLKPVPRAKAVSSIKSMNVSIKADYIKAEQAALRGGYTSDLIDENLQEAREQAKQIREDVIVGGKKLFYASMVQTLIGESKEQLDFITDQYKSKCSDFDITPRHLVGQQIAGLNISILSGNSTMWDYMMPSNAACALFPFNIQELTDNNGHFYGINAVSKNLIMFNRKYSKLANGLIFGISGSGKSVTAKSEMIANLLDGEDDMIILDPENEYRALAAEFDGVVIDLEPKSDYCINPCDLNMEWADPKATPLITKCDYMVSLVESMMDKPANVYEVNVIHRATKKMYEEYIENMTARYNETPEEERANCPDIDTEACPTLVDFWECLKNDGSPEGLKVANGIETFCTGAYSLFAHKTNVDTNNRITVYNLLYLPEKMKDFAMKVCLANIWSRILKNREMNEQRGTNKSIWCYLDEFHLFFQTQSSAITIMQYYKRVRKYGGIMTGITQDVADLLRSSQGQAMFNNTGFFIFLNQSPLGREQLQGLYQLSDAMIDNIKDKPSGMGLIYNGTVWIPFDFKLPKDNDLYKLVSTNPNDVDKPLLAAKTTKKSDDEESKE
jgi:hypothetical protein